MGHVVGGSRSRRLERCQQEPAPPVGQGGKKKRAYSRPGELKYLRSQGSKGRSGLLNPMKAKLT